MDPRKTCGLMRIVPLVLAVLLGASTARAADPASPTEIFSHDGVLSGTLLAAEGKVQIGHLELDGATYNGVYAGPVLHVHPGDLMHLMLVNHLSQPTNLHFHGIETSPLGNSDNAHLAIQSGRSFDYEVRIPLTQPPGLYWYHAHLHGIAEHQIMSGLSGTIVVEPPAPISITQRLFILKDMVFDDDTGNAEIDNTMQGIVQSVNGQLTTNEAMRPGETQLWRFTNQSANRALHITLNGHRFRIVAEDGEATINERSVSVLDISPSARVDVLVDAGEVGQYALVAKGIMTGTGPEQTPDREIGFLDVAGDELPLPTTTATTAPPPDLRAAQIDAKREVVFSETTTTKASAQRFFVNGKVFDEDRIDIRVPLGNIEEWTIRNDSDDMHIFHIHQIGFQVVEINGKSVPFNGYVDTVLVPERGRVKLRMPFTDRVILGRFVFHCHVLRHEDLGMMANIEVYDPVRPSLSARLGLLYRHVVWWWNGVPWSLCGLQDT
jgi:suppressor of ftsI